MAGENSGDERLAKVEPEKGGAVSGWLFSRFSRCAPVYAWDSTVREEDFICSLPGACAPNVVPGCLHLNERPAIAMIDDRHAELD